MILFKNNDQISSQSYFLEVCYYANQRDTYL